MLCYLLEHRSSLEEHSVSWSTLNSFYHTMVQTGNEPQPLSLYWSEVTQSCLTLCDPMGYNLPGSSVHGIFQAIVLEWIAISFSRGSSWPRDRTRVSRFTVWATIVHKCTLACKSTRIHTHTHTHPCSLHAISSWGGLSTATSSGWNGVDTADFCISTGNFSALITAVILLTFTWLFD